MPPQESVAGREALGDFLTVSWDQVVSAVESLPDMAEKEGLEYAIAWGRTHLRVMVDSLALGRNRTPERVAAVHDIHVCLGIGFLRVYARKGKVGAWARTTFLEAVERELVSESIHSVFERSRDWGGSDDEYKPET